MHIRAIFLGRSACGIHHCANWRFVYLCDGLGRVEPAHQAQLVIMVYDGLGTVIVRGNSTTRDAMIKETHSDDEGKVTARRAMPDSRRA